MTHSWRDIILNEFPSQVSRLTLVADPDNLLTEEKLLQAIRERGYDLITFEDHVAFRYVYESRYRYSWDRGETTDLVVVLRDKADDVRHLPYDLLQAGRLLPQLKLVEIFPNLEPKTVAALDRGDFDALYQAVQAHAPDNLGANQTRDFILTYVYKLTPGSVLNEVDILCLLHRLHTREPAVPDVLVRRLVKVFQQGGRFENWPLELLALDREAFFSFLQERWRLHLDHLSLSYGGKMPVRDRDVSNSLRYPGPALLPFDHTDVRLFVDTLFLEGRLQPVQHPAAEALSSSWVSVGLQRDPQADRQQRLNTLVERLQLPATNVGYREWLQFAQRWAEIKALRYAGPLSTALEAEILRLEAKVDVSFLEWFRASFGGLTTLAPTPPVLVHHIPRALARRVDPAGADRTALLILDGLALDQWHLVREAIQAQLPGVVLRESAVFAWAPSITSVSRQATFAGEAPFYFADSLLTTDREPALWTAFWEKHGLPRTSIGYVKALRTSADLPRVDELLERPNLRILGLVVDQVDDIMHGMRLGMAGMHQQISLWLQQGFLSQLIIRLKRAGFKLTVTADHGNIEAQGIGTPTEQSLADLREKRVRIYPSETLRAQVQRHYPESIAWPTIGLPAEFLPLMAPSRAAFLSQGDIAVSHGSISLEEMVVPLIEVEWKRE